MRRTTRRMALGSATLLVLVPGISASDAAWTDREWMHGPVGTSSMRCGTDDVFAAEAVGRMLSGQVLTTDLDPVVAVHGVAATLDGAGALTVVPTTAIDPGSVAPTHTRLDPLAVDVLSVVGLDLTGFGLGLPAGSAGALNQYVQVSALGRAAAAAGLVSDGGGVLVTPTTPTDQLPESAAIGLSTLLPAMADISDASLRIGAVASSAVLDGCSVLREDLWSVGPATAPERHYGVADIGLRVASPVLGTLTGTVNSTVGALEDTVSDLEGLGGLIAGTLLTDLVGGLVAGLGLGTVSGSVVITGLDLVGALGTLLSDPIGDGVITVDLASGHVDVDLDALLGYAPGALSAQPPNTELFLDDDALGPVLTRLGALLDTWSQAVTDALLAEIRTARLTVDLAVDINLLADAITVAKVTIDLDAPIGAILDSADGAADPPTASVTVTATSTGLGGLLLTLLGTTINGVLSALLGSATGMLTGAAGVLLTSLVNPVTALGTTLTSSALPLLASVSTLVDALPDVLSLMVNVQPDLPGAPVGETFRAAGPRSTAEYRVTALLVGLAPFLAPGDVARLRLGTSSAGPVAIG